MRHLHSGRKLGVSAPHRRALMRSLTLAIIERESIQTTVARAKELRFYAERAVTLAKKGDLGSRRHLVKMLGSTQTAKIGENRVRNALERLYTDYADRFKARAGGYTQILKLAERRVGDKANICIMRYIPKDADGGSKKKAAGKKGSAPVAAKSEKKTSKKSAEAKDKE